MTPATTEATEARSSPTAHDRVVDAGRRAAHLSHEAHLMKSVASDAIEDGVYAARRALKAARHRVEDLRDLKDETAYRVKREPFKAVAIAAGAGLVAGMIVGWLGGRIGRRRADS
jgi:ElaB/YqjD/DUF883 family membrane-anchored ribosome-binding protein